MGVNCKVVLNEGADWEKVGQVASVLLGAKVNKAPLGDDGYHALVEGFDNRGSQADKVARRLLGQEPYGGYRTFDITPSDIDILIEGDANNPVAKAIAESDGFPYGLWYGLENRSLYPKATAAKIALAAGLAKFFGGKGVYNDCSDKKMNFPSRLNFIGETDPAFYRYQDALLALKPLTQKDIDRCAKYASY